MSLRKISDLEPLDISKLGSAQLENLNSSLFEISFLSSYANDNGQNFSYRSMYVTYQELINAILNQVNGGIIDLNQYVTKTGNETISGTKTFSTKVKAGSNYKIGNESTTTNNFLATTDWVNYILSQQNTTPTATPQRVHHIGEVFCMAGRYNGTDAVMMSGQTVDGSIHSEFLDWAKVQSGWSTKIRGNTITLPNMNGRFIEGTTSESTLLSAHDPGIPSVNITATENKSSGLIDGSSVTSSTQFVTSITASGIKGGKDSLDNTNGLGSYTTQNVTFNTSDIKINTSTLAGKLKTQATASTVQPASICMYWYIQID